MDADTNANLARVCAMVLPALLALCALAATPSAFGAPEDGALRGARLLDAQPVLAQAPPSPLPEDAPPPPPTAPPLVDAVPEDGSPPPAAAKPAPASPSTDRRDAPRAAPPGDLVPVDRYANSVNAAEVAAAAGVTLVVDGLIGAGTLISLVMLFTQDPGLVLVGAVGIFVFPILGIAAAPLAAAGVAQAVAPRGYRAGSYGRAVLYTVAVHVASLVATVVLYSATAANSGLGNRTGAPAGTFTLGTLAVLRWAGMGAAASFGLHQGPASPPSAVSVSPAGAGGTGFPRVVSLPVVSLRF